MILTKEVFMEYKYYKIKNGCYFRYNEELNHFEILKNDFWEDDESLMSLYLEPEINYYEITDESIIISLSNRPKLDTNTK
jgi:hypothetical protein